MSWVLPTIGVLLSTSVQANIWVDEDFDDGTAFDSSAVDTFDAFPPTAPGFAFSEASGTVSSAGAYNGSFSYLLASGETIAVASGSYENPTNGAFQYLQFAISLGGIPSPGKMAELRWDWNIDESAYSFFVRLQSNGTEVQILAGEDRVLSTSQSIGSISDTSTWRYLTLQMQKNGDPAIDNRIGETLSQGMRFYLNDALPAFELLLPGAPSTSSDQSEGWSLSVDRESVYIDDIYWEGGMTNGDESSSQLRPFQGVEPTQPCGEFPHNHPIRSVEAMIDPVYENMLLPQPVGWLGSDVAHSIPLSATQNLWLFADTFIGTVSNGSRDGGAAFINSSIGIQDLTQSPPGNVQFYWGPSNTSFFPHQPGTGGDFYWPTNGILLDDELFVFCYNVEAGGPFGFSLPGTTLIRVPNPHDPPEVWVQEALDLGIGDNNQGFHSAVYVEEPYVYFLGYDDDAMGRRAVLARALIDELLAGGNSDVYEFLIEGPSGSVWGPDPMNLVSLFRPGITETHIQFDSQNGLYLCTTYNPFTPEIYLTAAPDLTGPWSEPVCIYRVPEHDLGIENVISYAVRLHPELATQPGEMVITYATNVFGSLFPLFSQEGLGIYHPRFVRAQIRPRIPRVSNWIFY